ncbi:hypothetical protein JMC38_002474, partial [Salmonella enterica]|nr:hypothetical protein [Salmonella enterica]
LIAGDIEQTAIMLMLDLLPVCELATSEDIPIIKKIKLTNKITLSDFKPLLEYIDYIEIKTPSFYNLDEKENLIKGHFRSEEFWNFITDEIKKEKTDRINNSAIMKFLKKINEKKLSPEKSKDFFKSMPSIIKEMKEIESKRKDYINKILKDIKKTP